MTGLKNLDFDIASADDGTTAGTLVIEAGTDDDADKLRVLFNGLFAMAKMQLSRAPEPMKGLAKNVMATKIGGTANKVEIQNSDFVLGVGAGALFPAISSAMHNAQTSAQAIRGRNLFVGIIQANVDRAAHGLDEVWPRTSAAEGALASDIAGKAYSSATEYFSDLFDIANYGTEEWAPFVDVDAATLGKDVVKGKTVDIGGLDWCIAANVNEPMDDTVPVLVSANFNPEYLLDKWDGITDGDKPLPIGPASGAAKSLFGDRAIVIIYKGGAASVIKKKDLNYNSIYQRQAFRVPEAPHPLAYLTPKGAARPTGRPQNGEL